MDYADAATRRRAAQRAPTQQLARRARGATGCSGRTAARTTWVPRSSRSPRAVPGNAVLAAKREWSRRHFADVADMLGWALHRGGRQRRRRCSYARRANALGARNAGYLFHLGMIELALGKNGDARRDLSARARAEPALLAAGMRRSPQRPCPGSAPR